MFHLKFWYMAFSNLGSHSVLDPSWYWVALTKFCASKSFLFLRISWYCYSLPSILILYSICQVHRITFFSLLSCHQPFLLGGRVYLEKRPHDLSGSTQCLRIPCFLCLHPTNYFPHPIYCSKSLLSWWDCVYLLVNPTYLNGLSLSAFKILPLPLFK